MRFYIIDRDMSVFTTDSEERATSFKDSEDHVVIDTLNNLHLHTGFVDGYVNIPTKGELTEEEKAYMATGEDDV